MNWFSKHPMWLNSESLELLNNTIYKEKYQFIDRTLISVGEIIVHKEETKYFPILIVFPDATPYIPPTIYVLKKILDADVVEKYSQKSPKEIAEAVQEYIMYFNRRHQNGDGSICFVTTGDLHSDNAEFYPIKDIIKRLRIWFSGRIPKDSIEVELYAHFRNKDDKIEFLLPDTFFDVDIVKGLFYASLPSILILNLLQINLLKKIYMGIIILGENNSGVILPPKIYWKKERTLFSGLPDNLLKFIANKKNQKIQQYIDQGKVIEGYWWDISQEPEPFTKSSKLAFYIGNSNLKKGFDELIKVLKVPIQKAYDVIYIGLRFPGRRQQKDWQFFKLEKGNIVTILGNTNISNKEVIERFNKYSVKAVYQEYFTEKYFHMRNEGRANRSVLKDKSISVIGCGALGSEIADSLAKAGIGKIFLVDKELLRAHNAIRHCLGITRTGYPKALGMVEHLILHNPFVDISFDIIDITTKEISRYLPEGYIGISSIADDNVESYLNERAVEKGNVIFYCRALRGGKAARIFRIDPQKDACKNCLSLYSREKNDIFLDIGEDKNLPELTNECNNPVRPASAADSKLISSITSRIVIDYLEGKNLDKNHWIWSSESLDKLKLDRNSWGIIKSQFISPHPDCPICKKLESKNVLILKEVYKFMKNEVKSSYNLETGGILIGYINTKGEYVILRASSAGPKAIIKSDYFLKDKEYCQKELERAIKELGKRGLYLGEWHYHPQGTNSPSGLDIKSLTQIAEQVNYRIDLPILIILSPSEGFALTIHSKNSPCIRLPLHIIDSESDLT